MLKFHCIISINTQDLKQKISTLRISPVYLLPSQAEKVLKFKSVYDLNKTTVAHSCEPPLDLLGLGARFGAFQNVESL